MGPHLAAQRIGRIVQEVPEPVSRELPPPPPSDTRKRATQIKPESPIILFGDLSLARLVRVVCPREEHPLREPDSQDRSHPSQTDELREVETFGEPDLELSAESTEAVIEGTTGRGQITALFVLAVDEHGHDLGTPVRPPAGALWGDPQTRPAPWPLRGHLAGRAYSRTARPYFQSRV